MYVELLFCFSIKYFQLVVSVEHFMKWIKIKDRIEFSLENISIWKKSYH